MSKEEIEDLALNYIINTGGLPTTKEEFINALVKFYEAIKLDELPQTGLPDDDEVERKCRDEYFNLNITHAEEYILGAKWMRDLANKQMEKEHSRGYADGYQEGLYDQHNK